MRTTSLNWRRSPASWKVSTSSSWSREKPRGPGSVAARAPAQQWQLQWENLSMEERWLKPQLDRVSSLESQDHHQPTEQLMNSLVEAGTLVLSAKELFVFQHWIFFFRCWNHRTAAQSVICPLTQSLMLYFREDWLSAPACGWPVVCTWLPCQPGLPCVPVHTVYPPRIFTHAFPWAVSTAGPGSQQGTFGFFPNGQAICCWLHFPPSPGQWQGLLSWATGARPNAGWQDICPVLPGKVVFCCFSPRV